MARVALAMHRSQHPAALGPCARPRCTPDQVREALSSGGHELVEEGAEVRVVDVELPADDRGGPLVLVSLGRPLDPWNAIADPAERQSFIATWAEDFDARKRRALSRRAAAYADSLDDLLGAIEAALEPVAPAAPAVRYLGALFNGCALRPGTDFALGAEPRPFVLGRGITADVPVPNRSLARAHLEICEVEPPDALQVTDLGGTNGTWLCQPDGQVIALRAGDAVRARSGALVMPDGSFRFLVA